MSGFIREAISDHEISSKLLLLSVDPDCWVATERSLGKLEFIWATLKTVGVLSGRKRYWVDN